jgi:hypothetical protein
MDQDKALRNAQSDIGKRGPAFRTEMGQYIVQLGFEKGVEFGKQDTIEKVVAYLDSLMYYVSEQDRRLVCNFTKFDKFIEDLKKTVNQ